MVSRTMPERLRRWILRLTQEAARLGGRPRTDPPARAEVGGPLDGINDDFHNNYEAARTQARHEVPVFVVLADDLLLFHQGRRATWSFSPRGFHVIKSVAHAPVALYAAFERSDGAALDSAQVARLEALRDKVAAALGRLERDASALEPRPREDVRQVLAACAELLRVPYEHVSRQRLDAFAGELGPTLLRLADDATQLQLDALHAHVEEATGQLSPSERSALQVVVAGDHQARARSLAMQYFQKRLGEAPETERRVTYAEGVSDEASALALVGTRRLDRTLARVFFGEEQRLQRDILGDSARERLAAFDVEPIA
ncbi:MAG: hypothetical protein ABI134_10340 [Byssovorax sp.]